MASRSQSAIPPRSPTRLRLIALVAQDLARAEYLLIKVLGTEAIFVDPRVATWGLRNILGGDTIEVVSPIQSNTTASRLLTKRGDGGYMVIMQTQDAAARRSYLETNRLARVIFSHEGDSSVCVQYHLKGKKGGVIPELDTQLPSTSNPEPIKSRFSPWHACGADYASYSTGMKRHSDLQFIKAVFRLEPGDLDTEGASRQWEQLFGIPRDGEEVSFTNMRMCFTKGVDGEVAGLNSITIAVGGR